MIVKYKEMQINLNGVNLADVPNRLKEIIALDAKEGQIIEAIDIALIDIQFDSKEEALGALRYKIEKEAGDTLKLLGKNTNFTVALGNMLMGLASKLATAQSLDQVRDSAKEYLPLIARIQKKIQAGEITSVQKAQGLSDDDAILDALESVTKVADTIKSRNNTNFYLDR